MGFCYSLFDVGALPHGLVVLGIVSGAVMATGLAGVTGVLAGIGSMAGQPWCLCFAFIGRLGTYILYPIWTIWLSRYIILIK